MDNINYGQNGGVNNQVNNDGVNNENGESHLSIPKKFDPSRIIKSKIQDDMLNAAKKNASEPPKKSNYNRIYVKALKKKPINLDDENLDEESLKAIADAEKQNREFNLQKMPHKLEFAEKCHQIQARFTEQQNQIEIEKVKLQFQGQLNGMQADLNMVKANLNRANEGSLGKDIIKLVFVCAAVGTGVKAISSIFDSGNNSNQQNHRGRNGGRRR